MTTLQAPPPPDIRAIWAKGRVREQIRVQREAELEAIERGVLMGRAEREETQRRSDELKQKWADSRAAEAERLAQETGTGKEGCISYILVFLVIFVITVLAAYALGAQIF